MNAAVPTSSSRFASSHGARTLVLGGIGLLAFALLWELIGRTGSLGSAWPPLTQVIHTGFENLSSLYHALTTTMSEAAIGWTFGVLLAFLSGVLAVFLRLIRPGILHMAVVVNSIPVIALGPVLISIFPREVAPAALAAISVYFTTLIAITTGFASTKRAHDDLFSVLGARSRERFWWLQLPTALPLIVDGLKLAVPAAVLGAILGEWFGSPGGLGPILVATMQDAIYPLLWATALTGVAVSLIGFGIFAFVHRWVKDRYE